MYIKHVFIILYVHILLFDSNVYLDSIENSGESPNSTTNPNQSNNNNSIDIEIPDDDDTDSEFEFEAAAKSNDKTKSPNESDNHKKLTSIELDISGTSSTSEYEFIKIGHSGSFRARDDYYFGLVKDGKAIIWQSKNENENPKNVLRDGIGAFKSVKNVTISLINGKIREFTKSGGSWSPKPEVGAPLPEDDDDSSELPDPKPEKPRKEVVFDDEDDIEVFIQRGVSTNDGKKSKPLEMEVDIGPDEPEEPKQRVVIDQADESDEAEPDEDEPRDSQVSKNFGNLVELNIENKHTTEGYECYNSFGKGLHKMITGYQKSHFKARNGFKFSAVKTTGPNKKQDVFIWKAKNSYEHSEEVMLMSYVTMEIKELNIHLGNGTKRKFIKYVNQDWFEIDLHRLNPVTFNIDITHHSFAFYARSEGKSLAFIAKPSFVFDGLIECANIPCTKQALVWKADHEHDYATKVVVNGTLPLESVSNVCIFHMDGRIKHLSRTPNRWIEVEPSTVLDIGATENCYEYSCSMDVNRIKTFIPKGRFLFKGVRCFDGFLTNVEQTDIWEARSSDEYANLVMVVPSGNEKFVVIFQVNGDFRVFNRFDKSRAWEDHTHHRCSINLLRTLGIDLMAYKQKIGPYAPTETEAVDTPAQPVRDIHMAARASPSHHRILTEQVERVVPAPFLRQPVIPPAAPKPRGNNLIYLDIRRRGDIYGYTITHKDNKVIFRAIDPFLFGIVRCGDQTLWQYKGVDYPNKVLYKKVGGEDKVKVYFREDGNVQYLPRKPDAKVPFNPYDIQVDVAMFKKPEKRVGPSPPKQPEPPKQAPPAKYPIYRRNTVETGAKQRP